MTPHYSSSASRIRLGQLVMIPTRFELPAFLGRLDREQSLLRLLGLRLIVLGLALL
jgi:hypothetical protein